MALLVSLYVYRNVAAETKSIKTMKLTISFVSKLWIIFATLNSPFTQNTNQICISICACPQRLTMQLQNNQAGLGFIFDVCKVTKALTYFTSQYSLLFLEEKIC